MRIELSMLSIRSSVRFVHLAAPEPNPQAVDDHFLSCRHVDVRLLSHWKWKKKWIRSIVLAAPLPTSRLFSLDWFCTFETIPNHRNWFEAIQLFDNKWLWIYQSGSQFFSVCSVVVGRCRSNKYVDIAIFNVRRERWTRIYEQKKKMYFLPDQRFWRFALICRCRRHLKSTIRRKWSVCKKNFHCAFSNRPGPGPSFTHTNFCGQVEVFT